jgi:hypothetical protein
LERTLAAPGDADANAEAAGGQRRGAVDLMAHAAAGDADRAAFEQVYRVEAGPDQDPVGKDDRMIDGQLQPSLRADMAVDGRLACAE